MSGRIVMWGQADRYRGAGFGLAHLFWRDAATAGAIDDGHVAVCGYDPTHHNGVVLDQLSFRLALDDAPRCSRCERREEALGGKVYFPLGEHPADLASKGSS